MVGKAGRRYSPLKRRTIRKSGSVADQAAGGGGRTVGLMCRPNWAGGSRDRVVQSDILIVFCRRRICWYLSGSRNLPHY